MAVKKSLTTIISKMNQKISKLLFALLVMLIGSSFVHSAQAQSKIIINNLSGGTSRHTSCIGTYWSKHEWDIIFPENYRGKTIKNPVIYYRRGSNDNTPSVTGGFTSGDNAPFLVNTVTATGHTNFAPAGTDQTGSYYKFDFTGQSLTIPTNGVLWFRFTATNGICEQYRRDIGTSIYTSTYQQSDYTRPGYTAFLVEGTYAGALNFDGTNDYVAINNPFTAFEKEITVEWNANIDPSSQMGSGISQSLPNIEGQHSMVWMMHYLPGAKLIQFYISDNGAWKHADAPVPSGWHKFTGVASGSSIKIYMDGNLISTSTDVVTTGILNVPNSVIHLGKDSRYSADRFMKGGIDEVRIWNRALCAGEIQNNLHGELASTQVGLQQYYKFNHGSSNDNNAGVTTLEDFSGNSRNGSLINFGLNGATSNWVDGVVNGTAPAFVPPTATFTANGPLNFCPSDSVTFTANTGAGLSYQWTKDGSPIAGATAVSYTAKTTGSYNVTVTKNGCDASASAQQVQVEDLIAPTITSTQGNVIVALDSLNGTATLADYTGNVTATDNCSAAGAITFTQSPAAATPLVPNAATNVTLTATDASGMSANQIFTVTATDQTAPIVRVKSINVTLDATGKAVVNPAQVDNGTTDNSGSFTLSLDKSIFNCANLGPNQVVLTAVDSSGNTTSSSPGELVITVLDSISPVKPVLADVMGECSATAVAPTTTDNCSGTITGTTTDSLTYSTQGTHVITWSFEDASGNLTTATQNVVVKDTKAPFLPGSISSINAQYFDGTNFNTFKYSGTVPAINTNWGIGSPNATLLGVDQFSIRYTAQFTAPATGTYSFRSYTDDGVRLYVNNQLVIDRWADYPPTSHTGSINLTAGQTVPVKMDFYENGGGAVAYLYYTAPGSPEKPFEAQVPANKNLTVYLNDAGEASVNHADLDPGYQDNCGIASLTSSQISFNCSNIGANPVTLTVTDVNGNVSTGAGTVTVLDTIAPTALTQNITVQLDAAGNVSISPSDINNGSSDNCSISSLVLNKTSFSCSNIGANSVTLTVTDVNGNVSTSTATVTVEDKVAPVALANNVTVQLDASGKGFTTAALADNGSTDACGIKSLSLSKTDFDCSNVGPNQVTFTATDVNGNISTSTITVIVEDKIAPVAVAQNVTIQLNASGNASTTAAAVNNGSSDACGIKSIVLSKTAFDCSNVGENTVMLTVTDVNGNVSTAPATVTVEDNIAPAVLTQNVTVQLDANGQGSITESQINNGSSDNCSIASYSLDKKSFDCSNVGINTVTLTVTDVNGNVSSATATVTVEDNVAPVALTQNISVTLVNGAATISAASVDNGSNDACGIQSLTIDKSNFDCSSIGNNSVLLTVTDNNGNVSSATAIVNVIGVKPAPSIAVSRTDNTFTGLDSKTIALGYGAQSLTLTASNSTSVDHATSYSWSPAAGLSDAGIANPVFTPTSAGTYTFTVTATNEFGCTATTSVTISVIDVRCGNKNEKVLVCHKTGSAKNPWVQICISKNAVATHLKKGSTLGTCGSTATIAAVESADMSLEGSLSVSNKNTLSVYPNPFAGETTVTFNLVTDEAEVSLDLYDLKGVKVAHIYSGRAEAFKSYSFMFDGKSVPAGVYFFRLTGSGSALNFKVIVSQ